MKPKLFGKKVVAFEGFTGSGVYPFVGVNLSISGVEPNHLNIDETYWLTPAEAQRLATQILKAVDHINRK